MACYELYTALTMIVSLIKDFGMGYNDVLMIKEKEKGKGKEMLWLGRWLIYWSQFGEIWEKSSDVQSIANDCWYCWPTPLRQKKNVVQDFGLVERDSWFGEI